MSTPRPVALVTGASRSIGIGAATCRALAASGHDLAITTWSPFDAAMPWGADPDGGATLIADLQRAGTRVAHYAVDLADAERIPSLMADIARDLGVIQVLVNNAAHSTSDGWENLTAAILDAHYFANFRATALLSQAFLRQWPDGPGGRIISMSSGQSQGPMPGELAYAASKGAIEAFTRSLSPAAAERGVTVNAVNPGPADTGWMTPELKAALLPKFPFGRIGAPEDAARLIAFLASPDAAWITGQVIHSEGGFFRQ